MEKGCPILNIFGFLSKRWMLLILKTIKDGDSTFNGIKRTLSGISAKILSERLNELQEEGYVTRTIVSEKPIKIQYSLTKKGISLGGCLSMMEQWIIENNSN